MEKTVTSEFAYYFARIGIAIISGLVRGVYTQAHVTVLKNNSRTIAVLENGLLVNFPLENKKFQEKISQELAIISEFNINKNPDRISFKRMNRIITELLNKATPFKKGGS